VASAIKWNLTTFRGDRLYRRVIVSADGTPVDFTGQTVRSHVRASSDPASELVVDLSSYFTAGSGGVVELTVPDAVMSDVPVGDYQWSVVLVSGGQDTTYFVGQFTVTQHPTGNP